MEMRGKELKVYERAISSKRFPCQSFAGFGTSINLVPAQCVTQSRHSDVFVE